MTLLPESVEKAREKDNKALFETLGIAPESMAAHRFGEGLGTPSAGTFARAYVNETGDMCVTIVVDGEEHDIRLTDAQAAALVGAATTPHE